MVTINLNDRMKEELRTLKDDEKFTFETCGKVFVILTKTEYEKQNAESKGFKLLYDKYLKSQKEKETIK